MAVIIPPTAFTFSNEQSDKSFHFTLSEFVIIVLSFILSLALTIPTCIGVKEISVVPSILICAVPSSNLLPILIVFFHLVDVAELPITSPDIPELKWHKSAKYFSPFTFWDTSLTVVTAELANIVWPAAPVKRLVISVSKLFIFALSAAVIITLLLGSVLSIIKPQSDGVNCISTLPSKTVSPILTGVFKREVVLELPLISATIFLTNVTTWWTVCPFPLISSFELRLFDISIK